MEEKLQGGIFSEVADNNNTDTDILTADKTAVAVVVTKDKETASDVSALPHDDEGSAVSDLEVEAVPDGQDRRARRRERCRLVLSLCCTVLATVAVIVYGTAAADLVRNQASPLSEKLLGELLGVDVAHQGNVYASPFLDKIPPQTVTDGVPPGAAEHESAPETEEIEPPIVESYPIISVDLSVSDDPFAIINETPYAVDTEKLFAAGSAVPSLESLRAEYGKDAPVVLILHTHGTEAYLPSSADEYGQSESFRSLIPEDGVISVGREMKKIFESHGIGTIHIETMFDADDYNSAYYLAAEEIKRICALYPSVSYIFDVHRDAMVAADGTGLRPLSPSTSTVEGVSAAQIMLVVGTDHAGSGHTSWRENMTTALKMQNAALAFDPDLMRPLNLRSASFNQQYTAGSLIVEVGAAANSIEEARLAGMIFAEAASRVIEGTAGI